MGYTRDAIKGVSWTGLLRFLTKGVGFLEAIVLARILAPSQFGAYGVALLALGLLETLTETGVNIVLIQEQEVEKHVNSAWIVSIGRGFVITALLFFTSGWIAGFFHSPESLLLLRLISIVPLLRGFINPAVVTFQKELQFMKNFWYQAIILLVDTGVSIIVTFVTKQPIGIAIGLLAGTCIELILSFAVISPRPRFTYEKEYIAKIFHRGKWVTMSGIFDYLFFNSDNIAVGRILGAGSLGIYQLAYSLAVTPLIEISNVFLFVTFPIFTKLSQDSHRLRNAFLKTLAMIFILTIPYALICLIVPDLFVFILGEKWAGIAVVLPILALLGVVKSVSSFSSSIFLSEKRQDYTMLVTLVTIVGMLITVVPLTHILGIRGAGISAVIGSIVALPFVAWCINRIFSQKRLLQAN